MEVAAKTSDVFAAPPVQIRPPRLVPDGILANCVTINNDFAGASAPALLKGGLKLKGICNERKNNGE